MRRNKRKDRSSSDGIKNIIFMSGGILLLAVIAFIITFILYSNNLEKNSNNGKLSTQKIAELVPEEDTQKTMQTSSQEGKNVAEAEKEKSQKSTNEIIKTATNIKEDTQEKKKVNKINSNKKESQKSNNKVSSKTSTEKPKKEQEKEITFMKPVDGEIIRGFAKDNLIYSETLKEWITHVGVDIKANKTEVVKASADGKIKSIKNDPRYGITVVIEHNQGFVTTYANLLTAEFVVVGESVKQGQTIGTVGNTATFEIADEEHLHFEISKDSENVDPSVYIK